MSKQPKHLKELVADPHNRRKHTPRNVGLIVDGLQKVGAARSIVIDENNEVLAGNATVEAASEAGITKVKVVDATGNEVVAVRRVGLTNDQKRDLAIYDNRAGELAEWDTEQLMKDVNDGIDLSAFFKSAELQSMVESHEDVNLDEFFSDDPKPKPEPTLPFIFRFTPKQHEDVKQAFKTYSETPEQVLMKLLKV